MPPRVPKVLYSKPLTSPELSLPEGFVRFEVESDLSYRFSRRFPWLPYRVTELFAKIGLAFRLLWHRSRCDVIVTGRYGEIFAVLQSLIPIGRKPHLLLDIEWHSVHRQNTWRDRLHRWYHVHAALGATRVQVFCEVEAKNYSSFFGIPESKFQFIPYASEEQRLPSAPTEDFLLASGFHQRDYRTLFAAIEGLPVQLRVVAQKESFAGWAIPANVRILGLLPRQEYRAQLAACRMVVVSVDPKPMRRSGVITYATALRLGKCCVVNDPSGASSYIQHGETGYLVPPEDPLALRRQIETLLANPSLIESAGRAAAKDPRFTPEYLLRTIAGEVTKLATGA